MQASQLPLNASSVACSVNVARRLQWRRVKAHTTILRKDERMSRNNGPFIVLRGEVRLAHICIGTAQLSTARLQRFAWLGTTPTAPKPAPAPALASGTSRASYSTPPHPPDPVPPVPRAPTHSARSTVFCQVIRRVEVGGKAHADIFCKGTICAQECLTVRAPEPHPPPLPRRRTHCSPCVVCRRTVRTLRCFSQSTPSVKRTCHPTPTPPPASAHTHTHLLSPHWPAIAVPLRSPM
jgi:hypothetical protein